MGNFKNGIKKSNSKFTKQAKYNSSKRAKINRLTKKLFANVAIIPIRYGEKLVVLIK